MDIHNYGCFFMILNLSIQLSILFPSAEDPVLLTKLNL